VAALRAFWQDIQDVPSADIRDAEASQRWQRQSDIRGTKEPRSSSRSATRCTSSRSRRGGLRDSPDRPSWGVRDLRKAKRNETRKALAALLWLKQKRFVRFRHLHTPMLSGAQHCKVSNSSFSIDTFLHPSPAGSRTRRSSLRLLPRLPPPRWRTKLFSPPANNAQPSTTYIRCSHLSTLPSQRVHGNHRQ
jgi:hypothetical protein